MTRVRGTAAAAGGAALLTAALALVVVTPAAADQVLGGSITAPDGGSPLATAGFTMTGEFHMSGDSPTIDSVSLAIAPDGGQPVPTESVTACQGKTGGCGSPNVSYSWNVPPFAYNGAYRADASATGQEHHLVGTTDHQGVAPTVRFSLAVAPAAPRSFSARIDPVQRESVLGWSRNQEPDTLGYGILRAGPGEADFQLLRTGQVLQPAPSVSTLSFIDRDLPKGGTYRYEVYAVRSGAAKGQLLASAQPATGDVAVPAPPVPPTVRTSTARTAGSSSLVPSTGRFGRGARAASGGAGSAPDEAALPDPGFSEVLPFHPATARPGDHDGAGGSAAGDARVLGSGNGENANHRTLLTSVAGAALLFVLAFHLRRLARA